MRGNNQMKPSQDDYAKRLEALIEKALAKMTELGKVPDRKVALIVAVGEMRDQLRKYWGAGKEPMEALLAMRDAMAKSHAENFVIKSLKPTEDQ